MIQRALTPAPLSPPRGVFLRPPVCRCVAAVHLRRDRRRVSADANDAENGLRYYMCWKPSRMLGYSHRT